MAGELLVIIAHQPSLGVRLYFDRELSDSAGLIATMIVILVIGIVVDLLFETADNSLRRRWGLQQVRNSRHHVTDGYADLRQNPVRAASRHRAGRGASRPVPAEKIAVAQNIPRRFLDNILLQLRRGRAHPQPAWPRWGLLAGPARRRDHPGRRDHGGRRQSGRSAHGGYPGVAGPLADVWSALRAHEETLLTEITLAHIAKDSLP